MRAGLTLLSFLVYQATFAQLDSLKYYYQLGMDSYKAGDHSGFLSNMEQADSKRELYPPVIYNLAAGYALNGDTKKSIKYLSTYLTMNSTVKFQEDADFTKIRDTEEYKSAIELANKLNNKVIASQPFRIIAGLEHPESVAFNQQDETIYVGDVRARKVYSFDGKEITAMISLNSHPEFYGVTGLELDQMSQKLWICTTMLPQTRDYTEALAGLSSVFYYDLNLGELQYIGTISGNSNFGDLTVSKTGKVYISDGTANKIYTVEDHTLKVLIDLSDQALNLQGVTLSEDQQTLFVADYILGIFEINLQSLEARRMSFKKGIPFKGIDGLYCYRNTLYALQNGTTPMRVIQLFFDPQSASVYSHAAYDQAVGYLNEPTQGFLTPTHFIYISNSPWGAYDDDGNLTSSKPLILRKISIK